MKRLLLLTVLLMALLSGCVPKEHADIAATTAPVHHFTTLLCQGTGLTVTRLVTESVSCLHDYSLSVPQVKSIEAAQVIVISGGGLEEFMEDVLEGADTVVDSSVGIELECGSHSHDHQEEHGHHHDTDPHFWLSPLHAKTMAENICSGLIQQFPGHETTFRTNLDALCAKLDALYQYGKQTLEPLACRDMITFHDGFGYLAQAFDLHILKAIEEESGSEASAQELIGLIRLVEDLDIPAIFTECNGSVSAADIVAAETGITSLPLDMAMAGDDYFEAMYHNIDTIKEALG